MKLLESADQLKSWQGYREYLKETLKLLDGQEPAFVSKDKIEFDLDGTPWKGHAFLAGKKAVMSVKKLKKEGLIFRETICVKVSKDIQLGALKPPKLFKETEKTFLKLRLGYKVKPLEQDAASAAAGSEADADSEGGQQELIKKAGKIEQAVMIWEKTTEAATKELRKLQKAILALKDPRGNAVIKGLEGILQRLDTVDDEAREAADAAGRGDAQGFEVARQDFVKKMERILKYVKTDELIREADTNPGVDIKIRDTITNSLNRLMKVV